MSGILGNMNPKVEKKEFEAEGNNALMNQCNLNIIYKDYYYYYYFIMLLLILLL